MARKVGDRARGYEAQRDLLTGRMAERLAATADRPSLRELARAAGVSVPTLVHYFDDRDGVVAAVVAAHGARGAPYLEAAADAALPFEESMRSLAALIAGGFASGRLADVHRVGLQEGAGHAALGPAYLRHVLEPTLQAVERKLAAHQGKGEMRDADVRAAALAFVAPLVLAGLHQTALGGSALRPLDQDALAAEVAEAFVLAYAAPAAGSARRSRTPGRQRR